MTDVVEAGPARALPRLPRTRWIVVGALAAVVLAAVIGRFLIDRADPPIEADAMGFSVSLRVVGPDELLGAQEALAIPGGGRTEIIPFEEFGSYVVGQLHWTSMAAPDEDWRFHLFVIDKRTDRAMEAWATSWAGDEPSMGMESWIQELADHYDWLRALRPVELESGDFTDVGQMISLRVSSTGPLTFIAHTDYNPSVFGDDGHEPMPPPDPAKDLLVVAIGSGGYSDFWWVDRVHG